MSLLFQLIFHIIDDNSGVFAGETWGCELGKSIAAGVATIFPNIDSRGECFHMDFAVASGPPFLESRPVKAIAYG